MRDTLRRTGVSETDFIRECDAAFKQGSKFVRWREEVDGDYYHHPFVLPPGFLETHLATGWMAQAGRRPRRVGAALPVCSTRSHSASASWCTG